MKKLMIAGIVAAVTLTGTAATMGAAAADKDIVDTAVAAGSFKTLAKALQAADLVGGVAYLVVTLLLYELLKPVSRRLSLLAAFFSIVGIAIGAIGSLGHLAPLFLLNGATYLTVFNTAQLQALALLSLKLHAQAYLIALVFFGFYEVLLGYLIVASAFLPRALGAIVGIAGLAFLVNSFAIFLSPPLGNALNSAMLAMIERLTYFTSSRDLAVSDGAVVDVLTTMLHRGVFGAPVSRRRATASKRS